MRTVREQLRAKLSARQGGFCRYCELPMTRTGDTCVTIDHFVPKAAGGSDGEDNLVAACWLCNQRKGSLHGDDFLAILRLQEMPASTIIIGSAFMALVAVKVAKIQRDEQSNNRVLRSAAKLLAAVRAAPVPEPIDPDQDCTGDMPEKSPVRKAIEDAQARSNEFGGATRLRYPERWKAGPYQPHPPSPKRDWL